MNIKFQNAVSNTIDYVGEYCCLRKSVLKFSQYMCMTKDLYLEYMKNYKSIIKTNNPIKNGQST